MNIVVLTSKPRGIASSVLPELCNSDQIRVVGVVVARRAARRGKRSLRKRLGKVRKIGFLGAVNGIRLRSWYADGGVDDIRSVCKALGVECHATPMLNGSVTRDIFRGLNADLGLSLGNGYIHKSLFTLPRHGMINIHTEILPDYQGALSVIWPIYEGKRETGFTIHQIDSGIDTGAILYQERYPIAFSRKLRDTVETNIETGRNRIPKAFKYVCENYGSLRAAARAQADGKSYTTPSFGQFVRMLRNHHAMQKESLTRGVT